MAQTSDTHSDAAGPEHVKLVGTSSGSEAARTATATVRQDGWLSPVELKRGQERTPCACRSRRASSKGFLPVTQDQYLRLLDWTGRQARRGKRGRIPADLAPILTRLQITNDTWVDMVENFGRWFRRAAGRQESLAAEATRRGRCWLHGVSRSRELFA